MKSSQNIIVSAFLCCEDSFKFILRFCSQLFFVNDSFLKLIVCCVSAAILLLLFYFLKMTWDQKYVFSACDLSNWMHHSLRCSSMGKANGIPQMDTCLIHRHVNVLFGVSWLICLFHGGRQLLYRLQLLLVFLNVFPMLILFLFQIFNIIVAPFQLFLDVVHTFNDILSAVFQILFDQHRSVEFIHLQLMHTQRHRNTQHKYIKCFLMLMQTINDHT